MGILGHTIFKSSKWRTQEEKPILAARLLLQNCMIHFSDNNFVCGWFIFSRGYSGAHCWMNNVNYTIVTRLVIDTCRPLPLRNGTNSSSCKWHSLWQYFVAFSSGEVKRIHYFDSKESDFNYEVEFFFIIH